MKTLLSHFHASPKSVGAAIGGAVLIAAAFGLLTKEQAEAVTLGVVPVLALLIPERK